MPPHCWPRLTNQHRYASYRTKLTCRRAGTKQSGSDTRCAFSGCHEDHGDERNMRRHKRVQICSPPASSSGGGDRGPWRWAVTMAAWSAARAASKAEGAGARVMPAVVVMIDAAVKGRWLATTPRCCGNDLPERHQRHISVEESRGRKILAPLLQPEGIVPSPAAVQRARAGAAGVCLPLSRVTGTAFAAPEKQRKSTFASHR